MDLTDIYPSDLGQTLQSQMTQFAFAVSAEVQIIMHGLSTVHGPGAPKTLTLKVLGAPEAPEAPGAPGAPGVSGSSICSMIFKLMLTGRRSRSK